MLEIHLYHVPCNNSLPLKNPHLAHLHHVEVMLFAKNVTMWVHARVPQATLEILMRVVVLNVLLILTAPLIKFVSKINVKTHAQALAQLTHSAKL